MNNKIWFSWFFISLSLIISACSNPKNEASTAIALTIAAEGTANIIQQQQTQMAQAQIDLTQSALNLSLQQTQAALAQTQAALAIQIASTPTPTSTGQIPIQLNEEGTPIAFSAPQVPGINPISTMGVDFNGAKIYSQGSYISKPHGYMISIQLAETVKEIKGKFFLEVAAKKFTCSVMKQYPNRLYCTGAWPRGGYHAVRLYEDLPNEARLVFVSDILIPDWTPTKRIKPTLTNVPYGRDQ